MNLNVEIYTKDFCEDAIKNKNLREFLENTIKLFAEETSEFYDHWGEFPFVYGEKQINSIIVPAIHKYTKNIWLEQPFKKIKDNQRFLDIATTKGDNIYLIELKHSWNSILDGIAKYTDNEWEKAIEQISDINQKTMEEYFNCTDFNVYKIALMIMPTYMKNTKNHKILDMSARQYVDILHQEYERYKSIKNKANFIGTIKLNNPQKYKHGNNIYPFISFIAKIEKI